MIIEHCDVVKRSPSAYHPSKEDNIIHILMNIAVILPLNNEVIGIHSVTLKEGDDVIVSGDCSWICEVFLSGAD